MEKIIPGSSTIIPTVDLSPFMVGGDASGQEKVKDTIYNACMSSGVFQVENRGESLDQCQKLLELSKRFFRFPDKVKIDSTSEDLSMSGAGYGNRIDEFHEFEYVLMYSPKIPYNGVPTIQPEYRETFEKVFNYFVKISKILENIINDCFGFSPNFLKIYNNDRSWDFMMPMNYTPSTGNGHIGVCEHADPNVITIILQDDVSGLELFNDGEWSPIIPAKEKLVVVVPDSIQVLTNKKATHATHRALKHKGSNRLAIDFCYSFGPDKWVQPFLGLSTEIGADPKYRGFWYKDYIDLISGDIENPPARIEDYINISYYEI